MIMAGGTGGHIFPGLAVAEELRRCDEEVVWLGTRRGLEARLVPQHGIDIEWIAIRGLRGRGWLAWVLTPLQLISAVFQVLRAFRRRRPAVVLGLGGFVSAPGGVAAWLTRRPLIIHEQNAVAGTTNRLLAPFARSVFAAFPGAFGARVEAEVIGNPVRAEIAELPDPAVRMAGREEAPLQLLVIGGSQGARVLNELVPQALAGLPQECRLRVLHQGGREHAAAVAHYDAASIADAKVEPFIEDMAAAYAAADFVIARAGALTISELEAAGIGALLVPYPHAIDDHQTRNAESFARQGAGIVIAESELTPERLRSELEQLCAERGRVVEMARQARAQAHTRATERLAQACIDAGSKRGAGSGRARP
jgi:UDP-N-acetylglucosamine--N-acetylmuramyl-(pentapeptide) pyrophosphoryl-undecaprenol N-acetylglucosamine transferase